MLQNKQIDGTGMKYVKVPFQPGCKSVSFVLSSALCLKI